MKTVKNVEGLLDVLGDTSVIVIEEKDNKILYLNEKAKEINPELEKDKICDGLWKGQCENCPVKNIEQKEYYKLFRECVGHGMTVCAFSLGIKESQAFVKTHVDVRF